MPKKERCEIAVWRTPLIIERCFFFAFHVLVVRFHMLFLPSSRESAYLSPEYATILWLTMEAEKWNVCFDFPNEALLSHFDVAWWWWRREMCCKRFDIWAEFHSALARTFFVLFRLKGKERSLEQTVSRATREQAKIKTHQPAHDRLGFFFSKRRWKFCFFVLRLVLCCSLTAPARRSSSI